MTTKAPEVLVEPTGKKCHLFQVFSRNGKEYAYYTCMGVMGGLFVDDIKKKPDGSFTTDVAVFSQRQMAKINGALLSRRRGHSDDDEDSADNVVQLEEKKPRKERTVQVNTSTRKLSDLYE